MLKDNYTCDGQMSIFDLMPKQTEQEAPEPKAQENICQYSQHGCNKAELWKIADSLDELQCPHVCCRQCNTKLCGVRCNGSEEPTEKIYPVGFIGICDDPICSNCDYEFGIFDSKWSKNEIDIDRCPKCKVRLNWDRWHKMND